MFTKSLVVAIPLTAVVFGYSALVRDESVVGWTWYKIAAIVAVLLLTNAGQVWIIRNLPKKSFWIRFRSNIAIWTAFGTLLALEQLLLRPGVAATVRSQGAATVFFVANVVLLIVSIAFVNTVFGYLFLRSDRRSLSGPVHV